VFGVVVPGRVVVGVRLPPGAVVRGGSLAIGRRGWLHTSNSDTVVTPTTLIRSNAAERREKEFIAAVLLMKNSEKEVKRKYEV
jgi:hypothetical protein